MFPWELKRREDSALPLFTSSRPRLIFVMTHLEEQ
jgi:hypothetical protein